MRRWVAVLAAGGLLAAAPASGTAASPRSASHRSASDRSASHRSACPGAGARAGAHDLRAMRAAVLCLVNRQRRSRGLPALREDRRLDRSAQGWTAHMVASGQFTHGTNFASRITAVGFNWSSAGENIATGYPTPTAVVAGWMASAGHCRNILSPDYSAIGIGMVPRAVAPYGGGATWTQDFGLPMGKPAPSHRTGPQNGCPY